MKIMCLTPLAFPIKSSVDEPAAELVDLLHKAWPATAAAADFKVFHDACSLTRCQVSGLTRMIETDVIFF